MNCKNELRSDLLVDTSESLLGLAMRSAGRPFLFYLDYVIFLQKPVETKLGYNSDFRFPFRML